MSELISCVVCALYKLIWLFSCFLLHMPCPNTELEEANVSAIRTSAVKHLHSANRQTSKCRSNESEKLFASISSSHYGWLSYMKIETVVLIKNLKQENV